MKYKMIVRHTLFDFTRTDKGRLKLRSVKFLRDSIMQRKNTLLLIKDNDEVQFFVDGTIPVADLTREQFRFVAAASRFFGHMPDQKNLPVWLWADSLDIPVKADSAVAGYSGSEQRMACC